MRGFSNYLRDFFPFSPLSASSSASNANGGIGIAGGTETETHPYRMAVDVRHHASAQKRKSREGGGVWGTFNRMFNPWAEGSGGFEGVCH